MGSTRPETCVLNIINFFKNWKEFSFDNVRLKRQNKKLYMNNLNNQEYFEFE